MQSQQTAMNNKKSAPFSRWLLNHGHSVQSPSSRFLLSLIQEKELTYTMYTTQMVSLSAYIFIIYTNFSSEPSPIKSLTAGGLSSKIINYTRISHTHAQSDSSHALHYQEKKNLVKNERRNDDSAAYFRIFNNHNFEHVSFFCGFLHAAINHIPQNRRMHN